MVVLVRVVVCDERSSKPPAVSVFTPPASPVAAPAEASGRGERGAVHGPVIGDLDNVQDEVGAVQNTAICGGGVLADLHVDE